MAKKEFRIKRAIKRKNLNLSQIKKRMALQVSDKEKINSSHFIIQNNKDLVFLENEFEKILKKLI